MRIACEKPCPDNKIKNSKIGIVTFPISEAGVTPLSNLVQIFCAILNKIYLITGGVRCPAGGTDKNIFTYRIEHSTIAGNVLARMTNYTKTQLRFSAKLFALRNSVDIWVFFLGAEVLVLPILTAKLLRKKVVIASTGSVARSAQAANDRFCGALGLLEAITYYFADRIILYSSGLIEEQHLQKFRHKIKIAHKHFLDLDRFTISNPLRARKTVVGYIGRLSAEKGIMNFIKSIPLIIEEDSDVKVLVAGDGVLRNQVEEYICSERLEQSVQFVGWISHEKLPEYLNEIKLLVLPSYTEGLPNIMLEAMACGTPVLATSVGSIPNTINHGVTGFLIEDNSPETIAHNILMALKHPGLGQIASDGRTLVEREFTFGKAVEQYRKIMVDL